MKIRRGFTPSDTSANGRDDVSKACYFSVRNGASRENLRNSKEDSILLEEEKWAQSKCDNALRNLGPEKYLRIPFRTRTEYVGLVLALIHSRNYDGQIRRVRRKTTA